MDRTGKTRAFLTEFIIVILFFSVSAVITMELFVTAHNKSNLSTEKTNAGIEAQLLMETIKSEVSSDITGEKSIFYDENWNVSDYSNSKYTMYYKVNEQELASGALYYISIDVYKQDVSIYSLDGCQYASRKEQ